MKYGLFRILIEQFLFRSCEIELSNERVESTVEPEDEDETDQKQQWVVNIRFIKT